MAGIRDFTASALGTAARHGQWLLVIGLLLGIFAPGLAGLVTPWIGGLIGCLLFLAALRLGPRQALGMKGDFGQALAGVAVFQLLLPLALALLFLAAGWHGALPTALILMAAGAPLSGSPNLVIMTGHDPAPALRILTTGMALLPLTIIPAFWLTPALGGAAEILASAARLLLVILVSVAAAFAVRKIALPELGRNALRSIDGLSAIVMGAVVIGLMSAVGEAIYSDPAHLALNLVAAFVASFGLQLAVALVLGNAAATRHVAVPFAVTAGNRNIALFLTALPAAVTHPLLLFIGCYQIPMYLTPLLLGRIYRNRKASPAQDPSGPA